MTATRRLRTIFRWIGKLLFGLVILFFGLVAIGVIRESITRANYLTEFPAPGKMVTINSHAIHLNCIGSGSPTVVFESDLDQYGSLIWLHVQEEIGKSTRACSYDRAGILWSEPGPLPRDGETIATELKTVLETAGEQGPYLLVGHAMGGAYIRIFAGQYPDDIYGMVLLESSHPDMLTRLEGSLDSEIPDNTIRPLILLLSHLGSPGRYKSNPYHLPSEINDPVQAFLPESSMAWFDETVESATSLAQAGQYDYLGDFPLIVIASARPSYIENGQELHEAWLGLQEELLLLSDNSVMIAEEVGHYPQIQSPNLVIGAIQDILEE